jgi:hypothetical protein
MALLRSLLASGVTDLRFRSQPEEMSSFTASGCKAYRPFSTLSRNSNGPTAGNLRPATKSCRWGMTTTLGITLCVGLRDRPHQNVDVRSRASDSSKPYPCHGS